MLSGGVPLVRAPPRPVDLRVFSVAGRWGTRALPCPLTRVDPSARTRPTGAATKDTWLLA